MDRRQFLVAVPWGALLPSLASAQEPGRVYRMAVISPSEAAVELIRNLMMSARLLTIRAFSTT